MEPREHRLPVPAFDALPVAAAADLVRPCAGIGWWVDAVVAGRPYGTLDALLAAARALAADWTDADVDAALAQHPRIGERHAATPGTSAGTARREAAASEREQGQLQGSGDAATDAATAAAIRAGNQAYEDRFGRIFLVRAAGRSRAEVLALLQERLTHTPEQEAPVVRQQLEEIALLRLRGCLA